MRIFGDLDFLNQGALQNASFDTDATGFPSIANTREGRIAFFDKRLWVAAQVSGSPESAVWVPLTREINMYQHTQAVASDTWTVVHNLNCGSPIVQIYDNTNQAVLPDSITPTSANELVITFSSPMVGRAVALVGEQDGIDRRENIYQYTHFQEDAAQTWIVFHGLGTNVTATVYDEDDQVIVPQSIVYDSDFQATVTFSAPQAGSVVFVATP